MFPGDGDDAESLLRVADAAMFEAKRAFQGRRTCGAYQDARTRR